MVGLSQVAEHKAMTGSRRVWVTCTVVCLALLATQKNELMGAEANRGPSPKEFALRYLGQQIMPSGLVALNTTLGGLSGIDLVDQLAPNVARFVAISDDPGQRARPRFYTMVIDLSKFSLDANPGFAGVHIERVTHMRRPEGDYFNAAEDQPDAWVDAEAIRVDRSRNRLYWSSEGFQRDALVAPFIRAMDGNGGHQHDFALPYYYLPTADCSRGVRNNLAFESLALSSDGNTLVAAVENALCQDGAPADFGQSSPVRMLFFDLNRAALIRELVYPVDPAAAAPPMPGAYARNGLVELLTWDERRTIALERSYTAGKGYQVRLYLADLAEATPVTGLPTLVGAAYRPIKKALWFDLTTLGIKLENLEGLSFGPRLANGNRSLIVIADNNFLPFEHTQILAFEIIPAAKVDQLAPNSPNARSGKLPSRRGQRRAQPK